MRLLSDQEYISRGQLHATDDVRLFKAVSLLKERSYTFAEAREMLEGELSCLFSTPELSVEQLKAKEPAERAGLTKEALEGVLGLLEGLPAQLPAEAVKMALMPFADSQEAAGKGGRGAVLWPTRYALSGAERSPDPFTLISILGIEEASSRIRAALAIL
ncbi:MAG: hypothetical protein Q8O19_05810 [Rectinemataceae bacterium]|nr:hypothetical protein [Rectinemataceae bacterium]